MPTVNNHDNQPTNPIVQSIIEPDTDDRSMEDIVLAVARFSALGDVVMTVPVVYSLCHNYPRLRVVMVTRPSLTRVFVNPPTNLTVVGVDVDDKYKGIQGLRQLSRDLIADYGITDYVDIHDVLRSKTLGMLLRLRGVHVTTMVKDRRGRRELTRRQGKVMVPQMGARARYRLTLERAGFKVTRCFEGLYDGHARADLSKVESILGPLRSGPLIGIAPFAAHPGKIYPPDKMLAVIDHLISNTYAHIYLFGGGKHEEEVFSNWSRRYPDRITSVAGRRLGLDGELSLINHLDVMLAMDSGNMHLAAIAGTRTLSIWGATHPYCGFVAWRHHPDDIIQVTMPCRPCSTFGDKPCYRGDMACMNSIAPELVASRVMSAIAK